MYVRRYVHLHSNGEVRSKTVYLPSLPCKINKLIQIRERDSERDRTNNMSKAKQSKMHIKSEDTFVDGSVRQS